MSFCCLLTLDFVNSNIIKTTIHTGLFLLQFCVKSRNKIFAVIALGYTEFKSFGNQLSNDRLTYAKCFLRRCNKLCGTTCFNVKFPGRKRHFCNAFKVLTLLKSNSVYML